MEQKDIAFELLFDRLTWASGLVRERTCVEIAKLLIDEEKKEKANDQLRYWTQKQYLESVSFYGLMIYCYAKAQKEDLDVESLIDTENDIHKPSFVTEMLLRELLPQESIPEIDWSNCYSYQKGEDVPDRSFFYEYIKNFLPSQYHNNAMRTNKNMNADFFDDDFFEIWKYEWTKTIEVQSIPLTKKHFEFLGRYDHEHYAVYDTLISEVYRSAYLRTIACLYSNKRIAINDAYWLSMIACPVDIGLLKIEVRQPPEWWNINIEVKETNIETAPEGILTHISEYLDEHTRDGNEWILGQASGRVYESDKTVCDLNIYGVFQRCIGSGKPEIEEIINAYEREYFYVYAPYTLLRFEGSVGNPQVANEEEEIYDEWEVTPACFRIGIYNLPRWQYWQVIRGIYFPAPMFSDTPYGFSCQRNRIRISSGDAEIGRWSSWTYGLSEMKVADIPPSSGNTLMLKREKVKRFEEESGYVYCWLCKLVVKTGKYSLGEYEEYAICKDYGTTSIIRPDSHS